MKSRFLTTAPLATIAFFVTALAMTTAVAVAAEEVKAEPEIMVQIGIPGATFPCTADQSKSCIHSMGDYVGGFYRYAAGALSVIAAVLVMWGGIKWMTAAGNASHVNDAKETIYSAIIALIITFGSYLMLYTINPKLVSLDLPDINKIVGIEQGSARCSENPPSIIEGGGCPPGRECCGEEMTVNLGAGKTTECTWDLCNDRSKICVIADVPGQYGSLPTPPCVAVAYMCEKQNFPGRDDKRNWCPSVDTMIQKAKALPSGAAEYAQKFRYTGCGFSDDIYGADDCHWSLTLDKYFELFPNPVRIGGDDYEPRFIDCYTAAAEGVCWAQSDGNVRPKNCSVRNMRPCRNVTDVPRPVAGTVGGCLVKVGQTGSGNPDDYKCWSVPDIDPETESPGGWGTPPSY